MKLKSIKSLTIYCSSSSDIKQQYIKLAKKIGFFLAKNNIKLIYGGGTNGLMGALSNSVKSNGGYVVGIIPIFLKNSENLNMNIDEVITVKNMATRKKILLKKGDAIMALPGGPGTLEEITEIISWSNLGLHSKPIILFNYNNFWNQLINTYKKMFKEKFINKNDNELFYIVTSFNKFKNLIKNV